MSGRAVLSSAEFSWTTMVSSGCLTLILDVARAARPNDASRIARFVRMDSASSIRLVSAIGQSDRWTD